MELIYKYCNKKTFISKLKPLHKGEGEKIKTKTDGEKLEGENYNTTQLRL
jgi:hypothetical protein